MMEISISDVRAINHDTVKAFFTLHIRDIGMNIRDCKLVMTKDNQDYFIGFPSQKLENGSFVNLITLTKDNEKSEDFQARILKLILASMQEIA